MHAPFIVDPRQKKIIHDGLWDLKNSKCISKYLKQVLINNLKILSTSSRIIV